MVAFATALASQQPVGIDLAPAVGTWDRGLKITQVGPGPSDPEGEGQHLFNQISVTFRGKRVGDGLEGTETAGTVAAFHAHMRVGGPGFEADSVNGGTFSVLIDQDDDVLVGDRVGLNSAAYVDATTLSRLYGASSAVIVTENGAAPQAIGHEADLFIYSEDVPYRIGYNAWSYGTKNGSVVDSAFTLSVGGGTIGGEPVARWKKGFTLFTAGGTLNPSLAIDGDLFFADSEQTIANVFNFDMMTVSGHFFKGKQTKIKDDTTNSTSPTTGALILGGGAGIAGDLHVAGGIWTRSFFRLANADYVGGSAGASIQMTLGAASGSTHAIIQALNGGATLAGELRLNPATGGVRIAAASGSVGFFGATPAAKPTGVAVSAAGVHAALVTLGLIAA